MKTGLPLWLILCTSPAFFLFIQHTFDFIMRADCKVRDLDLALNAVVSPLSGRALKPSPIYLHLILVPQTGDKNGA